jgi:hypothetical protein
MCVRAAELAKAFGLGTTYGQAAVECLRQGSPVEAAAVSCKADVGDAYRDEVVREAWASMETLTGDDRFAALEVMLDASCGPMEAPAKAWFPRTMADASKLHFGRMILERAQALKWGWDFKAMYRELLKAAIGFDAEGEAQYVIGDEAFAAEDADYDLYLAYQVAHVRCDEAAALVAKRGLGLPKAETIFSDAKCFGASYGSLDWNIQEKDAPAWFDLAMRYGRVRLARKLADKLKDPKPAIEKVEKAAFDGGDFDAAMDFPARDGEDARQHQDRVLQAALDRGDEWFVVRWNVYGQNQVETSRRDGWIERAYLHALLRKDPKMAADCIAKHSVAATAEAGERVAFEEAMRAQDADTAIDLARVYKLGDDCARRAARLKARQIQAAERAKAEAAAARRKKRSKASGDWNP